MNDYEKYDAVALAELVRAGDATPAELVDAAIDRAETINPKINAIVTPTYDTAREYAERAPQGPLHGVPLWSKTSITSPAYRPVWVVGFFKITYRITTATS